MINSLFNFIFSNPTLAIVVVGTFVIIFILRHLFIHRLIWIIGFHVILLFTFFILTVGGGGVQNAGYESLSKFVELEKNNQLDDARANPSQFKELFHSDLKRFKNSSELRAYLEFYDKKVDRSEAAAIGWFFALLTDFCLMIIALIGQLRGLRRK